MTTLHAMHAGTQSTTKALSPAEVLAKRAKDWQAFQVDLQERLELQDYEVRDAEPDSELSEPLIQAFYDRQV